MRLRVRAGALSDRSVLEESVRVKRRLARVEQEFVARVPELLKFDV